MSNWSVSYLALMLATVAVSTEAAADDTMHVYGTEMVVPEGWSMETGAHVTLRSADKHHFIELHSSAAVVADKEAIAALFAGRKNMTDVVIMFASSLTSSGSIAARGTLKIAGTLVSFKLIATPVGKRAMTIISYIEIPYIAAVLPIHDKIINSIRTDRGVARVTLPPAPNATHRSISATDSSVRFLDCDSGTGELYRSVSAATPEIIGVGIYASEEHDPWSKDEKANADGSMDRAAMSAAHAKIQHVVQHAEVVDTRTAPHVLLLMSYEPMVWSLDARSSGVTRVIAIGYHPMTVEGAPAGVKVETRSRKAGAKNAAYTSRYLAESEPVRTPDGGVQLVSGRVDQDWLAVDAATRAEHGAPIAEFAGCYRASKVTITDSRASTATQPADSK